jgi:peptide-methionine (S)-S-oxide reductase
MRTKEKTPFVNTSTNKDGLETATFGAGCFWCVEAVFQRLEGVETVVSGYAGGKVENPTYGQVSEGNTGHAEVIQLTYNPNVVSYPELLEVFWKTHDPTTLNRQGADVGTQYRSAVFYHTTGQRELAEQYRKELDASGAYNRPIVTEIAPMDKFYEAEDYHQNYFNQHGSESYCSYVIVPKLEKFEKVFKDKVKAAG